MISLRRRLFYIGFIILFFVITPLLFLYAMGYSIGNGFKFQKTGILVIASEPSKAKIYLNGELQQDFIKKLYKQDDYKTTPQKIKNLVPGQYNIKLELEGYWPWEKKLTVEPGQSIFAEDIKLFKKDTPVLLMKGEKNISAENDQGNIIAWNKQEAAIINLNSNETKTINLSSSTLPINNVAIWSPNANQAILGNFLLNKNDKIINLKAQINKQGQNFQWDNNSNEYIYYSSNTGINKYHLSDELDVELVSHDSIDGFFPKKDFIYFLSKEKETTILNIFDTQKKIISGKINLPLSNYSFINKDQELLNIFDIKYNILYIIDVNSSYKKLKDSISNISQKNLWISDTQLLYANDFEIWMYDIDSSRKKLITRIGKKITNIFWLPTNGHILFSTDNSINVIELDDREKYNITKLIESGQIKNPVLNKKGDALYFETIIGEEKGIYKLSID